MKSRSRNLRTALRRLISEEVAKVKIKSRLSMQSVDDQIDSLLMQFEEKAISEGYVLSLRVLLEAPGDEEDEGEAAPQGAESPEGEVTASKPKISDVETPAPAEKPRIQGQDSTTSSAKIDAEGAVESMKPRIDINQFASRVARLIDNYQSLLDIPSVILTRSQNFLTENYDEATAEELFEVLETEYGIALDPADNTPTPPAAAGAGPT
jgi:hypothetical protein